jgi:hypothetical protein
VDNVKSKVKCNVKDEVKGKMSDKVEVSAQPSQASIYRNGMEWMVYFYLS